MRGKGIVFVKKKKKNVTANHHVYVCCLGKKKYTPKDTQRLSTSILFTHMVHSPAMWVEACLVVRVSYSYARLWVDIQVGRQSSVCDVGSVSWIVECAGLPSTTELSG